jgi:hypothetical protein
VRICPDKGPPVVRPLRFVAEWRKWLDSCGGGGPTPGEPGPLLEDRTKLDRYAQHTRHCPHCLQVGVFNAKGSSSVNPWQVAPSACYSPWWEPESVGEC